MRDSYPCPVCKNLTRGEKEYGTYDVCPVCFWEDDDYQTDDPESDGGANEVSLIEARENFKKFGAIEKRFINDVRKPNPDEIPPVKLVKDK
jgi:hypothetical protein